MSGKNTVEDEERDKRRRFLTEILYNYFFKIVNTPKIRALLTSQEIEAGLEIVIDEIVKNIMNDEAKLGRKLTFREFTEHIIRVLNKFAPETGYII